jgi:O-acetyl-ADP-ribose deacetylase (regulator of RNase III)
MIHIVTGDLFTAETQTIVNTVNCVGVMGKGIALEYKKRYPEMFERYKSLCERGLIQIGKLWLYKSTDKWILNFPTKDHWKNKTEVQYLVMGLGKFVKTYKEQGITSISFPLLGANNGGLDPRLSLDLMKNFLKQCDIPVYIYDNQNPVA